MRKPARNKALDQKKMQKVKTRKASLEQTESVVAEAGEAAVANDSVVAESGAETEASAPVSGDGFAAGAADTEASVPVANADIAAAVVEAESIAEVGALAKSVDAPVDVVAAESVVDASTVTERVLADEAGAATADAPTVEADAATVAPVVEADAAPESVPTIAENMTTADVERLLQKIRMEITFSDDSMIEKEVYISGNENREKKQPVPVSPEDTKMPWGVVVLLSVIVCASLITGIYHWYRSYAQPSDPVLPAHIADVADDALTDEPESNNEVTRRESEEPETQEITRPRIEPPPEFAVLWQEHGNEDIVAVLTIGETEFTVVQSNDNAFYITHDINRNPSPHGWVFLDHQVDLLMGLDHNMVIYDPVGGIMREAVQDYAEYDFFLRFPTISFSTIYGDFEWEIFSYYVAPSDFPFDVVNHPNDDVWGDLIDQFTLASLYNTRLDVNMDDQVMTIVVPTGIDPELFYILQARMLRHITS